MAGTEKGNPLESGLDKRFALADWAALALLLLLIVLLFRDPLFGDRVQLSFDTRLWPPFSGQAPPGIKKTRSDMIHADLPCWMMPERLITTQMMDQGIQPLWTPYTLGGMPLLAGLAYPIYYPANFLLNRVLGMSPLKSLGWQTVINLLITGLGMYLFLRILCLSVAARLMGGLCLCLSGWYLTHAYIPLFVNAGAWVPLMFWSAEKMLRGKAFGRHALLLCIFTGFSFLGGFPQITITGLYGAGFWLLMRAFFSKDHQRTDLRKRLAPIAAFAVASAAGLGLSMIQLFPAAEFKSLSLRDQDYPASFYEQASLDTAALIEQVAPGFFGHPVVPEGGGGLTGDKESFLPYRLFLTHHVQNNFMENALYIGALPFLLALAALGAIKRSPVWIFLILSGFALLVALGTPLLDLAYQCLPGLKVGGPKRILILHIVALSVLSAFGLDLLFRGVQERPRRTWTALITAFGLLGALLLTFGFASLCSTVGEWWTSRAKAMGTATPTPEELEKVFSYLRRCCWPFVAALIFFGGLRIVFGSRWKGAVPLSLALAFTVIELCWYGNNFITSQPAEGQYTQTRTTDFLVDAGKKEGPFRVVAFAEPGRDELLMPNLTSVHGIQCLGGVSGLVHRRYGEYCHAMDPGLINMDDPRFIGTLHDPESLSSAMLNLLGIRYVAIGREGHIPLLESKGYRMVFREDRELMALFENPAAMPRAFVVTSCVVVNRGEMGEEAAKTSALSLLKTPSPGFDPATWVILEDAPPETFKPRPDPDGKSPSVTIRDYQPLSVKLDVEMGKARGFLVLTDTIYPGWEALVDGVPAPILTANYTFRAVPLNEGNHEVNFQYRPTSRTYGIIITCASLLLMLAWGFKLLWTRRSVS